MKRTLLLVFILGAAATASASDRGHDHDHAAAKNGATHAHATHDGESNSAHEFAALDADRNDQLSRAEIPAKHRLYVHFDMLDEDKSGTLSEKEFANGQGM